MKVQTYRRSARIQKLRGAATLTNDEENKKRNPKALSARPKKKKAPEVKVSKKSNKTKSTKSKPDKALSEDAAWTCLPRTRELELIKESGNSVSSVMGIDEAGRGPLAGPLVAAAAIVSEDIAGITDSKKLTKDEHREDLYEKIVSSQNVRWAVAVVDAARIDEINILQATMQGMHMAASALVHPSPNVQVVPEATVKQEGCYVVKGETTVDKSKTASFYALVDGNRVPGDMPCGAEALVKGDSREYSIAAASILAKVTRDRLMREYDVMYPEYQLGRHKGYPTVFHMAAVRTHGASPIHRRTFAPLKHMQFDKDGRVVEDK